jgi:hypothetical protein
MKTEEEERMEEEHHMAQYTSDSSTMGFERLIQMPVLPSRVEEDEEKKEDGQSRASWGRSSSFQQQQQGMMMEADRATERNNRPFLPGESRLETFLAPNRFDQGYHRQGTVGTRSMDNIDDDDMMDL